jgi:SRSO17 transposase
MQRLLRRAGWDADRVRHDVWDYVVEQLGDRDGVLIADDTGFLEKGTRSAGVQRQYSGRGADGELPGRGVPGLRLQARHALIDRGLHLPQSRAGTRSGAGQRHMAIAGVARQ